MTEPCQLPFPSQPMATVSSFASSFETPPLHMTCAAIGTLQSNEHSSFTWRPLAPGSDAPPLSSMESLQASLPPAVSSTFLMARLASASVPVLLQRSRAW